MTPFVPRYSRTFVEDTFELLYNSQLKETDLLIHGILRQVMMAKTGINLTLFDVPGILSFNPEALYEHLPFGNAFLYTKFTTDCNQEALKAYAAMWSAWIRQSGTEVSL